MENFVYFNVTWFVYYNNWDTMTLEKEKEKERELTINHSRLQITN